LTKKADVGDVLSARTQPGGATICELSDLTRLEVEVQVQEAFIRNISGRQRCEIRPDAFPELTLRGEVSRIMPMADRSRAAVPVRVRFEVPAKETRLRLEMGAIVSFIDKGM
jgi:hypothetical protein